MKMLSELGASQTLRSPVGRSARDLAVDDHYALKVLGYNAWYIAGSGLIAVVKFCDQISRLVCVQDFIARQPDATVFHCPNYAVGIEVGRYNWNSTGIAVADGSLRDRASRYAFKNEKTFG
jgi:hypothetical protein